MGGNDCKTRCFVPFAYVFAHAVQGGSRRSRRSGRPACLLEGKSFGRRSILCTASGIAECNIRVLGDLVTTAVVQDTRSASRRVRQFLWSLHSWGSPHHIV